MTEREVVRARLLGVGSRFEVEDGEVLGRSTQLFVQRKRSLRELVAAATVFDDREFLVLGDQRWTYPEVRQAVSDTADALQVTHGVKQGDRVGILGANRPEWVIAFFAIAELGAIAVAMNGWWTTAEIEYGLDLTKPVLVLGDTKRLARVPPATTIPTIDIERDGLPKLGHGARHGRPNLSEDDPALVLFTSGTTGRPKGALISHRGLIGFIDGMIFSAAERVAVAGTPPAAAPTQVVTLATSPLFHVSGLFGSTLMAIVSGGKLVFRSGAFDPEDVLRLIETERITSWGALGSMGYRVLDSPALGTTDTSSLTRIGFGGAPVSPELQFRMREAFPNASAAFSMGYGSSESVAIATSIGGDDFVERPESCGRATPFTEIEIRDENGAAMPVGKPGRINVRSPWTMLGYFEDPEATAATIDADGWLDMGDVGWLDADGFLTIDARASDQIMRAAENISPTEIEHRLLEHPTVGEAAVFGIDHPELGQEVKAVVVPAKGENIDTDALAAHCAKTLASMKVPSSWEIRPEPLPRNAAGKVLKRHLA